MIFKRILSKKGFTLIELIVVIAILGILASLLVPSMLGYSESSREAVDEANLVILNRCTAYYGKVRAFSNGDAFDGTGNVDIFSGITTNEDRMQELVNSEYLKNTVTPIQKNVEFIWDVAAQKWTLGATAVKSTSGLITLTSSVTTTSEVTTTGSAVTTTSSVAVQSVSLSAPTMKNGVIIVSYEPNGGYNASPKTLTANFLPSNATNTAVTWSSSDTSIATVDANGVVRFVKPGNSVITVTTVDGGKKATCVVNTQW